MSNVNAVAAGFSAQEALINMSKASGVSVTELMKAIIENPNSETAKYFQKLLVCGYKTCLEVASAA